MRTEITFELNGMPVQVAVAPLWIWQVPFNLLLALAHLPFLRHNYEHSIPELLNQRQEAAREHNPPAGDP